MMPPKNNRYPDGFFEVGATYRFVGEAQFANYGEWIVTRLDRSLVRGIPDRGDYAGQETAMVRSNEIPSTESWRVIRVDKADEAIPEDWS